jgi:hypothetical protein
MGTTTRTPSLATLKRRAGASYDRYIFARDHDHSNVAALRRRWMEDEAAVSRWGREEGTAP